MHYGQKKKVRSEREFCEETRAMVLRICLQPNVLSEEVVGFISQKLVKIPWKSGRTQVGSHSAAASFFSNERGKGPKESEFAEVVTVKQQVWHSREKRMYMTT